MKKKRKKAFNTTVATVNWLGELGLVVGKTSYYNPFSRKNYDLFGFIDLIAVSPDYGIVGVQLTGGGNLSARVKKILEIPEATDWLKSGGRIWVCDWVLVARSRKRKMNWVELTLFDLEQ